MSQAIITVENLGKKYSIHHQRDKRYTALRDVITDKAKSLFRRDGNQVNPTREAFWALKNVSFDVRRGEVVGIIGRNGAGKTTLLKILSRITEPTEGRVRITGRVASLLEVGTGFHPELTGRENIFLNGAILGMTRAEIKRKFDEIVDFAEVEKFLDTPVKRYSSGLYVRLAFAVAAHLEPEILVIDEVLAVGDVQFQKKCLGKMESVSRREGRTVLFVSHNMAAVEALCSSAMVLASGLMIARGNTLSMVQTYLDQVGRLQATSLIDRVDREGTGELRFVETELADSSGKSVASFRCGTDSILVLHCRNNSGEELRDVRVSVGVNTELDQRVLLLDTNLLGQNLMRIPPGEGQICIVIPKLSLLPGRYHFTIWAAASGVLVDWIKNAGTFGVEGGDYFGTGKLPHHGQGFFVTPHVFLYERKAGAKKTEEPVGIS